MILGMQRREGDYEYSQRQRKLGSPSPQLLFLHCRPPLENRHSDKYSRYVTQHFLQTSVGIWRSSAETGFEGLQAPTPGPSIGNQSHGGEHHEEIRSTFGRVRRPGGGAVPCH